MKELIVKLLSKEVKLDKKELWNLVEVPPSPELGDYAFPCFVLTKKLKKNPNKIAEELTKKIKLTKEISQVKASGPYLNFFINKKILAENLIKKILTSGEKYGKRKENEKVVIEFLSPNTNKPLHLGHLRNMLVGESIARILEFSGNNIKRVNLYNDRGIHIVKSMLAYQKYGKNKTPEKTKEKSDKFVGNFYVLFNEKAKTNKKLEEEAREMLRKWESGDKNVRELWRKMNSWAIKGIENTYKILGVKFDKHYYESKIYKKGKEIIEEGLKKGLFKKRDDNAVIINLGKELGEKVLLRSDGTSVYITQDLYLAKLRYQEYKFDDMIYVVANEQDYHFKVLFKILKLLKYPFAESLHHLSYGMVFLPEGKMKSREGKVVDADDLIEEMLKSAEKELKKRSLAIALSAIKYFFLKIESKKGIIFNPDKAIDFEGNTGPYLQYSYARASSILRKAEKFNKTKKLQIKVVDLKEQEIELVKKLAEFPEIIKKARQQLNPGIIANYSFQLAQIFNEFYHNCQVLGSIEGNFRLALVEAFRIVMKKSLELLGIEVLEEM